MSQSLSSFLTINKLANCFNKNHQPLSYPTLPSYEELKMPPKHKADEHASRINYLFQAGEQVAQVAPMLNQHYGQIITVIAEKTAAKRDFTMKRSMCKKCKCVLVPGVNMTYRLRKRKHKKSHPTMVITCKSCLEVKLFPTQPDKKLKAEHVPTTT